MGTVKEKLLPLVEGESLTWEEFEERFDATPNIKFAELIGGKVYIIREISYRHGESESDILYLLKTYALKTMGCNSVPHSTCRMFGDAPLPDVILFIRDEFGGHSRSDGKYLHGAPELLVEICVSSADRDLREKKDLYRRAGVKEYIVILPEDGKVLWHRLNGDKYHLLEAEGGVIRSVVFPGLWVHIDALIGGDMDRCMEVLEQGLASPEHAKFVAELAARRT